MHEDRLVIVDDDREVVDFVTAAAGSQGLTCVGASDSHQFRSVYPSVEPALVLLDLDLPGGEDGIELLRFLADCHCRARIALISGVDAKVLSAAERLARFHGLNLVATLNKPIELADLERVLAHDDQGIQSISRNDLSAAFSNGEMLLYYQPKIQLQSPSIAMIESVEALIRWQHPKYGVMGPEQFVPLAETYGLTRNLTDFVLKHALEQVCQWRNHGWDLTVAVNLSPLLLSDAALPDRIGNTVKDLGLPNSRLVLEVTERSVIGNLGQAMETLTRLRLKNVMLALDDFGTGCSSLVQLYNMPFSELKIDKSFVADITRSDEAHIIVHSTIDLAHNLGMVVCAEGVEDWQSAELLRTWGCEMAQGFFFAPPMPGAELQALILDKNWTTREMKSGMKDGQVGYKRTRRPPLPTVIVSA